MTLDKIITLANRNVELRFIAMVRSLRDVGCNLTVMVIPYDNAYFNLPDNCEWVCRDDLFNWLDSFNLIGLYRKYFCFLQENYLFVDSDVIFLRNPIDVFRNINGFVTSCGHWKNTLHTTIPESESILKSITTNWQTRVFNSGQFACSEVLFEYPKLLEVAGKYKDVCLSKVFPDQPAINLLVNLCDIPITNLTLPPYSMESTWAGDYPMEDFERFWEDLDRKPFIIHWAGRSEDVKSQIDFIFLNYLTTDERVKWEHMKKRKFTLKYLLHRLVP